MSLTIHGYLEQPYLTTPYLASTAEQTYGMQVNRVIAAAPAVHQQVSRTINAVKATGSQTTRTINAFVDYGSQVSRTIAAVLSSHMQVTDDILAGKITRSQVSRTINAVTPIGSQVSRAIAAAPPTGMQVADDIVARLGALGVQVSRTIAAAPPTGMQVSDMISAISLATHMQAARILVQTPGTHLQVKRQIVAALAARGQQVMFNTFVHEICAEYLIKPYLSTPYLANDICAQGRMQALLNPILKYPTHMQVTDDIVDVPYRTRMQVSRTINFVTPTHQQVRRVIANATKVNRMQVQRVIAATKTLGGQVLRRLTKTLATHMSVSRVFITDLHMQATMVLYNTTNLRVLDKFPSRGNDGVTWTASSTAAGDFSPNNLNNDIVEYCWRTVSGTVSSIQLTNDSQVPQGVFLDTLAFLGHNLTLSASVIMQSSQDPTFSTGVEEITLTVTATNLYYIAPTLPTSGYRYRRFLIDDPTNPDGYVKIGTIVYGAALILIGDDIVDQIKWKKTHYKDVIPTEAFTNVSNDRALRRKLGLTFKDIDYARANYMNLEALFDYARTSLKCLWIPTPQYPTRFGIFGKLVELPDETHNDKGIDIDLIDFNLEVDESL